MWGKLNIRADRARKQMNEHGNRRLPMKGKEIYIMYLHEL